MSWIEEAEHLRDYGHTWGAGIDDCVEISEEEEKDELRQRQAYDDIHDILSIEPSSKWIEVASQMKNSELFVGYPSKHRNLSKILEVELQACKEIAKDMGYEVVRNSGGHKDSLCITFELADFNVIRYSITGFRSLRDFFQMVANITCILYITVSYKDRYNCNIISAKSIAYEMSNWLDDWSCEFESQEECLKAVSQIDDGDIVFKTDDVLPIDCIGLILSNSDKKTGLKLFDDSILMLSTDLCNWLGYMYKYKKSLSGTCDILGPITVEHSGKVFDLILRLPSNCKCHQMYLPSVFLQTVLLKISDYNDRDRRWLNGFLYPFTNGNFLSDDLNKIDFMSLIKSY